MKKRIALCVAALIVLTTFAAFGEDKAKKIDAWFYNIKVNINGETLNTPLEPFIYNDSTYVPLRAIVEGMGGTPSWDDATKTITIKDSSSDEIERLKNEISALNLELNTAKSEIDSKDSKIQDLEDEIEDLEDSDDDEDDNDDISDLEEDIEDSYDTYSDDSVEMEFTYSLDTSSSTIEVEMTGNFSRDDDTWLDRDEYEFQDFIEDIIAEIHDSSDFDDYDIEITVYDEDDDKAGEYSYDEGDDEFSVDDEY